jgi:hypothetical protein
MAQAHNENYAKSQTVMKCTEMKTTPVRIYLSLNKG